MNYLISKILKFITDQNVISSDEEVQDFYRYGIEISISSLLNIILVLAVGLLIHHVSIYLYRRQVIVVKFSKIMLHFYKYYRAI